MPASATTLPTCLPASARLSELSDRFGRELTLAMLVDAGMDRLPSPGAGRTLARWRMLAAVAAHDLSLVKLFEGHTDALAILAELGAEPPPHGGRLGTWCAEGPDARVDVSIDAKGQARLSGIKAWCSGAATVSHGLVSCWNSDRQPCLALVAMDQAGVRVSADAWQAVGMRGSASADVQFDDATARLVGRPGDYTGRPGFWQGGAGIAACWYGGAFGIAETTRQRVNARPDAHRLAHLGAIDIALAAAAAVLRDSAAWIDAHPKADAQCIALRARLVVEHSADQVMTHAARALGAAPLCRNARFAQAMADLPVYLRQSHAERDLAALGDMVRTAETSAWTL